MSTTDPSQLLPGSNHEVTKVDGAFQIRPTETLAARNRMTFGKAAILSALLFAPLTLIALLFGEVVWAVRVVEVAVSVIALVAIWMALRRPAARQPLVIHPDGKIRIPKPDRSSRGPGGNGAGVLCGLRRRLGRHLSRRVHRR
jgi:hypothetical protein